MAGPATAQDPVSAGPAHAIATAGGHPVEGTLRRAGSTSIDLRKLPQKPPQRRERPEREGPEPEPVELPGAPSLDAPAALMPKPSAPAPAPSRNFDGLDYANWGAGHPPDTNGDVGPTYFIQSINSSIGIFRKSDGVRVAALTLDTFMSQGNFGNLCDTNNFGDPVVLYDTFEDRWIITDFAFTLDGTGNVINPPGAYECFAVSKTGDPVTGGWYFYSTNTTGGLADYPKLGVWPDGLYMAANMFDYTASGSFQNPRVYAFNKAQMYAGSPTVQVVSFNAPAADFGLLPSNARLQTGTPPAGTPNYFISTWQYTNAVGVYKFHVDWDRISTSTFTGPSLPLAASSWPNASVPNAPSLGGNNLDVLQIRAMMQNQYTNLSGVESLWTAHTVRRATTTGFAAPRWYQVDVTGGTVAASLPQAATWDPDGANVMYRFMPSIAIDRAGDLALGYSTSNSTTKPAIKYAGRLAGDAANNFSQDEQVLIQGTGTQTGNCGGSACTRWGDYSAMTLDPDGCTFWYTNMYYAADGLNHQTRIGAFAYPSCTPAGAGGTVSGTVTATAGGTPIAGATVVLGSRTTTTDAAGHYSFTGLPAGTYPRLTVTATARNPGSATGIAVVDSTTTTRDFALDAAPASACLTDTTQADFQTGVPATSIDLTTTPGDVVLSNVPTIDQQSTTLGTSGVGITVTTWGGQTFTPTVTGQLTKADINLFCSGCTGTTPALTLSLRATSGGLPTGADLASATIAGFNSGASGYYTGTFSPAPTLTAGTQYALVIRPTTNPSPGTYALTRSGTSTTGSDVYAGGTRVSGATNGTVWSIPLTGGISTDAGFKTYMQTGYTASGDLVSGTKDSNPLVVGLSPKWSTLSWTATTPASTALRFQVAASDSAYGPFSFVGPDGTAATYYTASGASLSQFNGKRYLQYRAYLTSSNTAATPALSDATVCYAAAPPDLSLTASDGGVTVAPGGTVSYTLAYANAGGQDATGVTLSETVPAHASFNAGASTAGWSCTPDGNAGSTCTLAVGSVAVGTNGSATFAVTLDNPLPAGIAQIANAASIAGDGSQGADPTPGNNAASDTTPVSGAPDLSISVSDGGTSGIPGGGVTYTLTYANTGNRGASGVVLTETVPANTSFNAGASTAGWSCSPSSNAGSTCTLAIGTVSAGSGNATTTFAVIIDGNLPGNVTSIVNTASIADDGSNGTDPTLANNTASDTTPIAMTDLAITVTNGMSTVVAGGTVGYTVTATNLGPSAVTAATLSDAFPAVLTCAWDCAGSAGGTCTTSGSGNIADSVDLPVGGSVTYTASCLLAASAMGILSDTATISAPPGVSDIVPGNNTASDTDTVAVQADVAVSLTDNRRFAVVGDSVDYVIEVSNPAGPSNATATVSDILPSLLTGGSWICTGTGGATCAGGTGNTLSDTASVPVGGKAAYVYSATVLAAGPTDQITNSATASLATGTDPNPANDTASDTDIIVVFKDGFEGGQSWAATPVGGGKTLVTAQLRITPAVLDALGMVPVAVASGRSAGGQTLFTLELARFGGVVYLRALTTDAVGLSERSAWQHVEFGQPPLLAFAWQSATANATDGWLRVDGDGTAVLVGGRREQGALSELRVRVDDAGPWFMLIKD